MNKLFGHLKTVTTHRRLVRRLCFKCGLIRQGLTHDLSKLSAAEFWRGVKYYQGNRSPQTRERELFGYSAAWLHHKGRNKHHYEYWTDFADGKRVRTVTTLRLLPKTKTSLKRNLLKLCGTAPRGNCPRPPLPFRARQNLKRLPGVGLNLNARRLSRQLTHITCNYSARTFSRFYPGASLPKLSSQTYNSLLTIMSRKRNTGQR